MSLTNDMIGKSFGRLTILADSDDSGELLGTPQNRQVSVRCECGVTKITSARSIRRGRTTSCGCAHRDQATTHGLSAHPLYAVWQSMKSRCYRPKAIMYYAYGARGIAICEEWRENPTAFIQWSEDNGYEPGLQIDRINSDGDYSPGNCRFVTSMLNNRNRRSNKFVTYRGQLMTLAQLSQESGVPYDRLRQRIVKLGWPVEKAAA